jgi:tRNA(fMet)-specific endonuclease VapC
MSGKRYLLDTNALVALIEGNLGLLSLVKNAEWIGVSIINVIEFLSFSTLTQEDKDLFSEFVSRIEVVDLDYDDEELMVRILSVRKSRSVKLPDAVVIASALVNDAIVVTNDAHIHKVLADSNQVTARAF